MADDTGTITPPSFLPAVSSAQVDLEALLPGLAEGVVQLDAQRRVIGLNDAAQDLLGRPRRGLIHRRLEQVYALRSEDGRETVPSLAERALREGVTTETSEIRQLARDDGVSLAVRERAVPITGTAGRVDGVYLVIQDVTELHALKREQQYLMFHDWATGLVNGRAFEGLVEAALRAARADGRQHAVGYLDLDDYEAITEVFGPVAGDEVVRQWSRQVAGVLGDGDQLARLGDVRFGVLLEDCPATEIEARAETLRGAVKDFRFRWQHETFEVGVTIGLVPMDATSGDLVRVLAQADAATKLAKDETRAVHRFDADATRDARLADDFGDVRWLAKLHKALKRGDFVLYRQPIVATPEAVAGATEAPLYEVLLRLRENGDVILPGQFIPAAERFQLIRSIDRWVVSAVLDRLAAEPAASWSVAINLSGRSVGEKSFLDFVEAQLDAHPTVSPGRVCFEITETAAVSNLQRAQRLIARLSRRGCRFVLDDFGTGLSSFAYLKDLAVDFVKIDGSFVLGLEEDPVQLAIIRAIQQVARVLGLGTIAEFVEREEIVDRLRTLGIDYAQGFWIRRPEPWD